MRFKDHFSGHAAVYRDARPRYDPALFHWLAQQVERHELAWDAGCGNGQASVALTEYFDHVAATDPSAAQIANADPHPRVKYYVEPAEHCSLDDASVDLITVAQAYHWFDHARFAVEASRVLRPRGFVAVWTYAHCRVDASIDAIIDAYYEGTVGPYWMPERRDVENGYANLPFPFAPVTVPSFDLVAQWDLIQFVGYLRSWSATQRYIAANGDDPLPTLQAQLLPAWGDAATPREVRWRLAVRAGRI